MSYNNKSQSQQSMNINSVQSCLNWSLLTEKKMIFLFSFFSCFFACLILAFQYSPSPIHSITISMEKSSFQSHLKKVQQVNNKNKLWQISFVSIEFFRRKWKKALPKQILFLFSYSISLFFGTWLKFIFSLKIQQICCFFL